MVRRMRNRRMGTVLSGLLVTSTLAPTASLRAAEGAAPPAQRSHLQIVLEFEDSLTPLTTRARERKVREFFAGLKDVELRREAVGMFYRRYVYRVPPSIYNEILGVLLRDPDPQVRSRAVTAVGYNSLAGDHADRLLELLNTGDPELKQAVFYALPRRPTVKGALQLRFAGAARTHLSHPDPQVRSRAAGALRELEPGAKELSALFADSEQTVRAFMGQIMPQAPEARRLITDPSPLVRSRVGRAMGDSGDRTLAPVIAPLLGDPESWVRHEAVYSLGRLKASQYGDRIVALLEKDEDVVVRRYAALALGDLRSAKHLPALRAAHKDEDEQVRQNAAKAIRLIEDPRLDPDSLR